MPKVVVIGGANVDIKGRAKGPYVAGTSNPGEVTHAAGGVGRNIADNLARLGITVSLVTALGQDASGAFLRHACEQAGVDLTQSLAVEGPSGTYLAILDEWGELVSAVNDMRAMDHILPSHLEDKAAHLRRAEMLVADCNLSAACLSWLAGFCAREGIRLLIEPVSVAKSQKLLQFERAQPVFAITPNAQQLVALTGASGEEGLVRLHELGFSNIVLHLGNQGALASDGRVKIKVEPLRDTVIADVTGAGDAAVAGLVFGLLEGHSLAEAARLGQCAAAIKLSSAESVAQGLSRDRLLRMTLNI
ncbi:carbohydrate kinase family protein [Aestuariivirga sp.]|uniref:carbohydrate kinase family protein n=1 Tax=Aestuariivirga sp. TaxID=2650926 RepID=UPI003BAA58A9